MDMQRHRQMQPVFRPPQLDAPLDAYYNMVILLMQDHLYSCNGCTAAMVV
jgi:hypothetical protein